jgi:D-amino-acid oxidase
LDGTDLDRRAALSLGLGAAAGLVAHAEPARAADVSTTLPRLKVSPELILREIAGLRPFRPSGFVVRSETLGDKIVVHNYGHGGCGVTLS